MNPFVSVVVPVYNSEDAINECLRCIDMLNYPKQKLEVIVVDDGSTDKTVEIAKGHKVKLIQKEHNGYPSTMNAGIRVTEAEIVVVVDSDTYVHEDWLIEIVKEFRDLSVGIVGGYVATKSNAGFWARIVGYGAEDRYDKIESKYIDFVTSTCTAYRKKLFVEVGLFDEALRRGSDEDLAHRALKAGWKIVLQKDAVCYHDWDSSFRKLFKRWIRDMIYELKNFRRHPELLHGKKVHPPSLYIPLLLMLLFILTPLWLLFGVAWVSVLSVVGLVLYHTPRAVRVIRKHRDWTMLLLPIVLNARYVAYLIGLPIGIIDVAIHR